jgi:hypothetical protein
MEHAGKDKAILTDYQRVIIREVTHIESGKRSIAHTTNTRGREMFNFLLPVEDIK